MKCLVCERVIERRRDENVRCFWALLFWLFSSGFSLRGRAGVDEKDAAFEGEDEWCSIMVMAMTMIILFPTQGRKGQPRAPGREGGWMRR